MKCEKILNKIEKVIKLNVVAKSENEKILTSN